MSQAREGAKAKGGAHGFGVGGERASTFPSWTLRSVVFSAEGQSRERLGARIPRVRLARPSPRT